MTASARREDILDTPETVPADTVFADIEGPLSSATPVDPLEQFDVPLTASDVPTDVFDLVREACSDPETGIFGPGSMVWEVFHEQSVYLGVASGIVLQVAHPKVGQGISDHGTLEADPLDRLADTFAAFDAVLFGDVVSAVRAAVTVRILHERVSGSLEADAAPFVAEETYHANDPELLLWVAATLIEVPLWTYEAYVDSLSPDERQQFYEEMTVFGRLMGVPAEQFPDTYSAFRTYFEETLASDIVGNPASERVVEGFLENAPATPVLAFLTGSLLPPSAREATGISWGRGRARLFDGLSAAVRAVPRSILPDRVRYRRGFREFDRHHQH